MQFPSTLLLTALGGHVAALPSNALLSPQRDRRANGDDNGKLSTARGGRSGRASTSLEETDSSCRPAGEDDSLTGVRVEPSSDLARFVECVVLVPRRLRHRLFRLGWDLALNSFIFTEINCRMGGSGWLSVGLSG
ncbi:hypothetical protein DL764_004075 [Monosporascus ibericus]|uniref:Uncharacterized protein n=1 Tax=Monosporascus ibericus TaxID=155417 RepID=A0A4Q4TE63_9PEZI|nr:hypothetical protein DL764_004075 [Monosporascus ibericus]